MRSFPQGIHPKPHKEQTRYTAIQRLEFAPYFVLLLNQQIGKPSLPLVQEGEEVRRGQLIAQANGDFSSPLHAPVTGRVLKRGLNLDMNGSMQDSLVIQPFPASGQSPQLEAPCDPFALSSLELIEKIKTIGMVGLGGAAFPTHLKLKSSLDKKAHTLVINGCECEPFLTADHRIMLEQPAKLLRGIRIILHILGAKQAVLALEENKLDALRAIEPHLLPHDQISLVPLKTKYPQGAEKILIQALFQQEVPSGGLPADLGIMVANVTTMYEVGQLLPLGQGIIERVVSVSGDGVQKPGNYLIPMGTPLEFILETLGLCTKSPQVIFGGPMMGKSVVCLQTPTTKGVTGILVFRGESRPKPQAPLPCINCGECLQVCPLRLNPCEMARQAANNQLEPLLKRFHLFDCFECGSCAWVCPSKIPLTQLFKAAKKQIRQKKLHPLKSA